MMKVPEHEHPLKLIDLQMNVDDLDEFDDEEEKNLVPYDEFVRPCNRCGQDINEYYRYYYKCTIDESCDYYLHKFCAELPLTLNHALLPYPLWLDHAIPFDWSCIVCQAKHKAYEVGYKQAGNDFIDVMCAIEVNKRGIHHPSHPHPLVSLILDPVLCKCKACGREHKGIFFQCTTCFNFTVHIDCAFLPKTILIQDTTNGVFQHTHPVTLSYSFPRAEQKTKHYPKCRVCGGGFYGYIYADFWIYKCEKCMYYVHLDCATSRSEPFMSMRVLRGQTFKDFKEADYPDILCLPFPDQTYSILKHLHFKEIGATTYRIDEVSLQYINHQHHLILLHTNSIESTSRRSSSLVICHDPLKKEQVLCNACVRPIIDVPFYKCGAFKDESCNFALHEWCTRLPQKVDNHPGHPKHTLVLMSHIPHIFYNIFECDLCDLPCNGFSYGCVECSYYIDVNCGFIPENITHKSHPNHLFSRVTGYMRRKVCFMCKYWPPYGNKFYYKCNTCGVFIHRECAFLLPEKIRNIYDKHPMNLSYLPIENHKSEYFCEICEEDLNPHRCFYHCDECVQSVHFNCAPLILQCERETYSYKDWQIYEFLNVKFGSIYKTNGHPHPLSFDQGIATDGQCSMCCKELRYKMIFKCIECKFAIDDKCCKSLDIS